MLIAGAAIRKMPVLSAMNTPKAMQWPQKLAALCAGASAVLLCPSAPAADRIVEFRDGSRLQLDVTAADFTLKPDNRGASGDPAIQLAFDEVAEVTFSEVPAFERLRRIKESLSELRSDEFVVRERAAIRLTKLGAGFRSLLEKQLAAAFDPEIRWRLHGILGALSRSFDDDFDHLRTGKRALQGELDEWTGQATYRGTPLRIDRTTVRSLTQIQDQRAGEEHPAVVVRTSAPHALPAGGPTIDFSRTPDGSKLEVGDDISKRFIDWGVEFSTSIDDSHVAIQRYDIDGASGGLSAATDEPLYEGTVSMRFCSPGRPEIPAGVHFVGCWVGVVEKGGTALVGYDRDGAEIGRAVTTGAPSQFLALRSATPIASAEIIPDSEIDPNYVLDDVVFSSPLPLDTSPHPTLYSLVLDNGDRLQAKKFAIDGAKPKDASVSIKPAGGFGGEIRLPLADVAHLLTPGAARPQERGERQLWAMLNDGSKIRIDAKSDDWTKLPLAALWNSRKPLKTPRETLEIPKGGAALFLGRDPIALKSFEFRDNEFAGTREDGSTAIIQYGRLSTIWFSTAEESQIKRHSSIEMRDGQRFAFGDGASHELLELGSTDSGLKLRATNSEAGGDALEIDFDSVLSIHFSAPDAAP